MRQRNLDWLCAHGYGQLKVKKAMQNHMADCISFDVAYSENIWGKADIMQFCCSIWLYGSNNIIFVGQQYLGQF